MNVEEISRQLYEAYCNEVGGLAIDGSHLPPWEVFHTDPLYSKHYLGFTTTVSIAITLILAPKVIARATQRLQP